MSDKTDISAFPCQKKVFFGNGVSGIARQTGMTLRDYFAAKAMQATLTGIATRKDEFLYTDLAVVSYGIADAMLAERNKEQS